MSFQNNAFQDNAFQIQVPSAGAAVVSIWMLLYAPPSLRVEPEADLARRADLQQLHRHRTTYQTVGQPHLTWPRASYRIEQELDSGRRADHGQLHLYRNQAVFGGGGAEYSTKVVLLAPDLRPPDSTQTLFAMRAPAPTVTAGAPWSVLFGPASLRLDPPTYEVKTDTQTLHLFRTTYQTVGQPWSLARPQPSYRLEPELDQARRADLQQLHRHRTSYQTVGQPWNALFTTPAPRLEPEAYTVRPTDQTPLYGRATTTPTVGAPWNLLWATTSLRLDAETYTVSTDLQAIHQFRWTQPFGGVGQPWSLLWPQPSYRLEAESYTVAPANPWGMFLQQPQVTPPRP